MFDHTRNTLRERDVLAMEADRLGWCESEGYSALQAMLDASDAHTFALREVAAAIGVPKDVDPLDDLDGLVLAVQAMAQRAESRDIRLAAAEGQAAAAVNEVRAFRIAFSDLARTNTQLRAQDEATTAGVESRVADAVAAERMAIGAWLRTSVRSAPFARNVENGDHIDDDAPPLPSLRMTLLLRDELLRQVEALTAERDRRIDPVEHARAVIFAYVESPAASCWTPQDAPDDVVRRETWATWMRSPERATLLARVGPAVLAEVER